MHANSEPALTVPMDYDLPGYGFMSNYPQDYPSVQYPVQRIQTSYNQPIHVQTLPSNFQQPASYAWNRAQIPSNVTTTPSPNAKTMMSPTNSPSYTPITSGTTTPYPAPSFDHSSPDLQDSLPRSKVGKPCGQSNETFQGPTHDQELPHVQTMSEDDKRKLRNREASKRSRDKKKHLIASLSDKVDHLNNRNRELEDAIHRLETQISELVHRNNCLVQANKELLSTFTQRTQNDWVTPECVNPNQFFE